MRRGQRRQQGKGGLQFLSPIFNIHNLLKDLFKLQKATQKPARRHNRNNRTNNHHRHHHHHNPNATTTAASFSSSSSSAIAHCSSNNIDCTAAAAAALLSGDAVTASGCGTVTGLVAGDIADSEALCSNSSNMNPSSQVTSQTEPDADSIKMFVGQIPRNMEESDLRKMFEDYGPVHSLNVLRDKNTGQSKGCCFVTFYTRKAALDAQNALHNIKTMPMMHHPIQMKPADSEKRNGELNVEERKLFVGMLSKKLNENDVRMLFAPFGTIEDCTVLRDANSTSRGCAFITFATRQCAMNAIKGMHHSQTMEGCSSPLVVKMADTQKEKEQKKMQQVTSNLWMQFSNLGALGPQYLARMPQILQQAAAGNMGGGGGGGNFNNMGNLGRLLTALAGLNSGNANALGNNSGNSASGFGTNSNTSDSSALQNLQGLAALANLANNPAAMNALGGQNMPFNTGASNNAGQGQGGSGMGGMGNMGNMGNMGGMGSMGGMGGNNMGSGFSSNMNGFGSNNSGMDALSQAYSGIQQYAASFPNAFNPQAQMAQANSAAGKQSEGPRIPGPDGANLFIYHLPQEFGDQDLMQMFMPFGNVVSAKVFIDKQTNLSKCFGFVSYDSPMAAQAAITSMNGFQIGMKRLKVQLKRPKNDKPY